MEFVSASIFQIIRVYPKIYSVNNFTMERCWASFYPDTITRLKVCKVPSPQCLIPKRKECQYAKVLQLTTTGTKQDKNNARLMELADNFYPKLTRHKDCIPPIKLVPRNKGLLVTSGMRKPGTISQKVKRMFRELKKKKEEKIKEEQKKLEEKKKQKIKEALEKLYSEEQSKTKARGKKSRKKMNKDTETASVRQKLVFPDEEGEGSEETPPIIEILQPKEKRKIQTNKKKRKMKKKLKSNRKLSEAKEEHKFLVRV
uniref:Uncharacterized protein n=1 Tax=Cacopsylla melanoneura TaxID=428564 RepID=A0A8D8R549_9HEMI